MTSLEERRLDVLFDAPGARRVLDALTADGDQAWLVGGCVRNALLGADIADIDLATQAEPDRAVTLLSHAGIKVVPTGLAHGTVTAVLDDTAIEVTTLRRDVETDGRRAVVAFSRDVAEDAARRDFTMNALYLSPDGRLHDPVDGLPDLEARRLRFIGDAATRIREDYLRILRYFRFFSWYAKGAPDREAVKAIVSNREGLASLSAERVWAELKKSLQAPEAIRGLLWMRQTGVYQIILPESGDMDGFYRLARLEKAVGAAPRALLRLAALLPVGGVERAHQLADRLKLSKAETIELSTILTVDGAVNTADFDTPSVWHDAVYRFGAHGVRDALLLQRARSLEASPEAPLPDGYGVQIGAHLAQIDAWPVPTLPVTAADLLSRGIPQGPQIGAALKLMEGAWVASDFQLGRDDLLAVLKTPSRDQPHH